jgi:hypothetical protein
VIIEMESGASMEENLSNGGSLGCFGKLRVIILIQRPFDNVLLFDQNLLQKKKLKLKCL